MREQVFLLYATSYGGHCPPPLSLNKYTESDRKKVAR